MKLTTVKEIYKDREKFLDQKVSVGGWVRSVRGSKAFGFIVLHDGSCFDTLQIVYHDTMENFAEISKLNVGAAIIVTGYSRRHPGSEAAFRDPGGRGAGRGSFRSGLSSAEEAPYHGVSPYHDSFKTADQYFPGGIPRAFPVRIRHS